jgi:hypothetical protein
MAKKMAPLGGRRPSPDTLNLKAPHIKLEGGGYIQNRLGFTASGAPVGGLAQCIGRKDSVRWILDGRAYDGSGTLLGVVDERGLVRAAAKSDPLVSRKPRRGRPVGPAKPDPLPEGEGEGEGEGETDFAADSARGFAGDPVLE